MNKDTTMKRNDAFPSQYLGKEDFEQPALLTISHGEMEEIKDPSGKTEHKPVLYFQELEKGLILNVTNWNRIEAITGADDATAWTGTQIVAYHDPNVEFGGKLVGGVRVRAPQRQPAPAQPPTDEQPPPPTDADAPPSEEEVPF